MFACAAGSFVSLYARRVEDPRLVVSPLLPGWFVHSHTLPHARAEAESEEDEEDEEEPILKFEDEPLEANEVVVMPDGSDGVVEGIRRGNVVVRSLAEGSGSVMETFKLEEVKRKHVAPPGYVRPQSE